MTSIRMACWIWTWSRTLLDCLDGGRMLPCVAFCRDVTCGVCVLWFRTIVDMENLPEVSVSIVELSRLREQWQTTVLGRWCGYSRTSIQCAQRPGGSSGMLVRRCSYCDKMIKCDMYSHVSTYHLDLAQVQVHLFSCGGSGFMVYGMEGYATGLHGSCSGVHDVP